jgi:hypothetical protein
VYGYVKLDARMERLKYEEDLAYLREICAKEAGDKIYRTVDNVQGVFQMKQRNPDEDTKWGNQLGLEEPWAFAFGDKYHHSAASLGTQGRGYWFVEQHSKIGAQTGKEFRRKILMATENKAKSEISNGAISIEGFLLTQKEINVGVLKSQYGYTTEDLTTPELRRRWISGGKLRIVNLQTNEVLGERLDYYKATGPEVPMAWSPRTSCPRNSRFSVSGASLVFFINFVLKPPVQAPTENQLSLISQE